MSVPRIATQIYTKIYVVLHTRRRANYMTYDGYGISQYMDVALTTTFTSHLLHIDNILCILCTYTQGKGTLCVVTVLFQYFLP